MSDNDPTAPINAEPPAFAPPPPPPPMAQPVPQQTGTHMAAYGQPTGRRPIGKVRETGICIVLTIVTLGFYSLYWYYATHDEMKRALRRAASGAGWRSCWPSSLSIVMPYVNSNEVGGLYARQGQGRAGVGGDWFVVLPRDAHPDRTHHLVREDERRAQRVLALARRRLIPLLAAVTACHRGIHQS